MIANARARLQNAADLMARELLGIALTADGEGVKLAAIKDALDRAGLKAPSEVVLSQGENKPYETVFDSIAGTPPEDDGLPSASADYGDSASLNFPPPAPADSAIGAADMTSASWSARSESSHRDPPRQPATRHTGEHGQPGHPHGASQRAAPHITGEAALRLANEANRQAGAWEPQRELESPHKRYPRP